jgi:hypothetical protein
MSAEVLTHGVSMESTPRNFEELHPIADLPPLPVEEEVKSETIEDAHDDSLTTILNDVVEECALKVSDIQNMHQGQIILCYLLDRNIGVYNHGLSRGTRLCTREYLDDHHLAVYIHDRELTGTIYHVDCDVTYHDWTWGINVTQWDPEGYWAPLDVGLCAQCGDTQPEYLKGFKEEPSKIPGDTKVGWRGPAILMSDVYHMPHIFTHYDTYVDDYFVKRNRDLSSFKTTNCLTRQTVSSQQVDSEK